MVELSPQANNAGDIYFSLLSVQIKILCFVQFNFVPERGHIPFTESHEKQFVRKQGNIPFSESHER